jgi:hypothetical protein
VKFPSRLFAISVAAACLAAGLLATAAQAAAPAWLPIAASGPTNLPPVQSEVQRVAVDAEGGVFTLTFNAQTTVSIDFDADATVVQSALNDLSSIGGAGGSVTVKGGPGDKGATKPYAVSFGGSLADVDLAQMSADSSGLTDGVNHTATVTTSLDGGPGTTQIMLYTQNVGGSPSSGPTTLTFTLPPGVTTAATPFADARGGWTCGLDGTAGAGQSTGKCTSSVAVGPGFTFYPVKVPVTAGPGAASGTVHVEFSGGGTVGTAAYDMPLLVSAIPAPPGLQSFAAAPYDENGIVDTRAGAHPYSASAGILVNTVRTVTGQVVPAGEFRNIVVETPPGFFGNPIATVQCPESVGPKECDAQSIVATVQIPLDILTSIENQAKSPVNNIEAPFGFPAKFRFITGADSIVINVAASLRSDEDYGLEVGSYDTPQIKPVYGSFFTFWGAPADSGHDGQRCINLETKDNPQCAPGGEDVAFLTNPVDCAEEALRPPVATISVNTWQNPGLFFRSPVPLKPVTGCEELEFEADFGFEPTSARAADSPASFRTELSVPTGGLLDPEERMNPTIRESVVELPKGVVLNASAADGLAACSKQQIGLKGTDFPRPNEIRFTKGPNTCPDNSKIGTGELKSELIEEPLQADLFLAAQGDGNPFGSLFAIYLVIEDPRHGIFIKLPGEVQVNGADGRQRVVFRDLPPLPFTWLKLNLKGGSRSPLATPTTCGSYSTTATNTPWSAPESGPPLASPSSFAIDQGPNATSCAPTEAARPFGIGLSAGSTNPVAGAHSPFEIQIARADGHQELDRLEISPPPGFVASLRGIPYCTEAQIAAASAASGKAEQAAPSCPRASQIGTTNAGAGSGPTPFYAPGRLYLAGPYKGSPLSVVAITPAVAGPFDLGNVLVRSALKIDPVTARITAVTDPLPRILEGVPLRIRDVRVNLDRPDWAQNPTSCEAMSVDVTAFGSNGAVSKPSNRFQVGSCERLAFKPRMSLRLFGGTKRGGHPSLRAVVRPRPGDANIRRAAVALPRSAFLDQANIRTICTRVQFAADACPEAAIYGRAEAVTPLLDQPLRGPVYLRSSDNLLPDLVADLRGPAHQPLKIEAAFRTDSIRGGIRSTIDFAPDAPVSRFVLRMQGGKRKGLIVNSQNLCAKEHRATARLAAHNDRRHNSRTVVKAVGCKQGQKKRTEKGRGKPSARKRGG